MSSWLLEPPSDPEEVARRYDDWAATYNHDLVEAWGYDAPVEAVRLLIAAGVDLAAGPLLDLGCGTGLVGQALHDTGHFVSDVDRIDGVDISMVSLQAAEATGRYRSLICHDFNLAPLPFLDHTYVAAICVGVLSYALDPGAIIRELARVVTPGGLLVFTHRVDLWDTQNFGEQLTGMHRSGVLADLDWTEPKAYMPGSGDTSDLRIRYVTCRLPR